MDTSEIRAIIRCQFEMGVCVVCQSEERGVALIDCLGICWCAQHQFRGEFVNLMSVRDWNALEVHDEERVRISHRLESGEEGKMMMIRFEEPLYLIAAGAWATVHTALIGSDEEVTSLALKALEIQGQEEIA